MKSNSNDKKPENGYAVTDDSEFDLDTDFATSTSCHGISYWHTSKATSLKIFWILIVITMTAILVSQVTLRFVAYRQYRTSTDISENFVAFLEFPAVTICSFNRYYLKKEERNESLLQFIHTLNHLTTSSFVAFSSRNHHDHEDEEFLDVAHSDFNLTEFSHRYGIKLDRETMPTCRFKTEECGDKNFKPVTTTFGMCHTFNDGGRNRIQNIPGSGNGLSMILHVHQRQYTEEPIEGFTEAGMKIQVHPPYEAPDLETFGVAVPVGQKAFIEINRIDNNLMHEPWGRCDPGNEKLKYFDRYTINNCIQECYTDAVIAECGCRLFTQYWAATYARECTLLDMFECAAEYLVTLKQNNSAGDCNCSIPCSFTKYDLSVAYATFPGYTTSERIQKTTNVSEDEVSKNMLNLEVYFGSMSYKTFTQSKKVDESTLISEVGGQLGLWVGMSFITIFEFVQYFVRRTWFCYNGSGRKRTRIGGVNH